MTPPTFEETSQPREKIMNGLTALDWPLDDGFGLTMTIDRSTRLN